MLDLVIKTVIIPVGFILSVTYFISCYKRGENPFFEEIVVEDENEN